MYRSGAVPFGFNKDRKTLCEPEAVLIREGVRMVNDGSSLYDVVRMFRESGVSPRRSDVWAYISVRDVLTPWRNAGVVSHGGEPLDVKGAFEAIVSRQDLETCRTLLAARKTGGERHTASRLMSGIARCGTCGEWLSGSNRNGAPHYSCTAKNRGLYLDRRHVSIRVDMLDPLITEAVVWRYVFGNAENTPTAIDSAIGSKIASVRAALAKVDDDQASLLRMRGLFPEAQVVAEAAALNAERDRLTESLASLIEEDAAATIIGSVAIGDGYRTPSGGWRVSLTGETRDEDTIRSRFVGLSMAKRRTLVRTLFGVVVGPGVGIDRVSISDRRPVTVSTGGWAKGMLAGTGQGQGSTTGTGQAV
jgi:hypothetical protein